MPDSGPYSLLILSFAIFSFVAWQLRGRDFLALAFSSAIVMLLAAVRLAMEQAVNLISLTAESRDLAMASFDALLSFSFLWLLTHTAVRVLILATTADPIPK